MRCIAVTVLVCFMASFLEIDVDSAVSSSSSELMISAPIEEVWGLISRGSRFPIIYSGDTIALRSAYTYGSNSKYWLRCTTSYCNFYSCPGTFMTSSKWSSCSSNMRFVITAFGKVNGEPIDSGDTVSLYSKGYSSSYRLRCSSSSSTKCSVSSSTSSMTGNNWLSYSYATFQIYSKNAVDGTPVQYGDVVGFKYPYYTNSAWLSYYSSYFYPRNCSSTRKSLCAAENKYTGFKIFKKLS